MNSADMQWLRFRDVVKAVVSVTELTTEAEKKEDHHRIIQMHYNQLLNRLTAVGDIIAEIFQTGNLTNLELEYLQSFESTSMRASAELLNIIMNKSSEVYENFLLALKNAKQQDAYLLLTTTSHEFINSDHSLLIRQQYDWLTKNIACDTGLISRLLQMGVLTNRELDNIGSKTDNFRKNETLLFAIFRKSSEDFAKFQQALIDTGQNAVVEKLKRSSTSESEQPNELDEHRFLIERNFCWLAETIGPQSELINLLFQNQVITIREREVINAERDAIKMNETLLKIISQKSITDFEQLKNALRELKQDHVVQKLMEEKSKMTVKFMNTTKTRRVAKEQIGDRRMPRSIAPPNPGKQLDGSKSRLMAREPPTEHPPKEQKVKTGSTPHSNVNFERLEKRLQIEISQKVIVSHLQNPGSHTAQTALELCLQTILEESRNILMRMKRKQKAEKKAMIQERELEKEKLHSELHSVKKALAEEKELKHRSEDQNRKTNEMYDRMKKQFEHQIKSLQDEIESLRTKNDMLSDILNNEKVLKEKAEQDLQEKNITVLKLGYEIEKCQSDIIAANNKSIQLEENLHAFTGQLISLSSWTKSYVILETKRLDIAIEKVIDVEKKLKCVAEKITSNAIMKSSATTNIKLELQQAKFESESTNQDQERLQIANEKYKNDFKLANDRSEESQHFVVQMLDSLKKSIDDWFCFETDCLDLVTKKMMDLAKKLKPIEEQIVSLRRKFADVNIWTSNSRLFQTIKGDDKRAISGVAIAGQELLISNFRTPEIKAYDLSALTLRRKFAIDDLENPCDLAFCRINGCLYIMDANAKQNRIIKSTSEGEVLHSWPTYSSWGCISVAFDSNIVLTSRRKDFILEYTSNGEEVQKIKFLRKTGLVYPTHAIKLKHDRFLISHGLFVDSLHRVCVIDLKGNVKVAFGGEYRSDYESFGCPGHMAITSNGSIIVIDGHNNRLLLLDSELEFIRVLIPREMEGLLDPFRFVVEESTARLFVVNDDSTGGESVVSVYKFDW